MSGSPATKKGLKQELVRKLTERPTPASDGEFSARVAHANCGDGEGQRRGRARRCAGVPSDQTSAPRRTDAQRWRGWGLQRGVGGGGGARGALPRSQLPAHSALPCKEARPSARTLTGIARLRAWDMLHTAQLAGGVTHPLLRVHTGALCARASQCAHVRCLAEARQLVGHSAGSLWHRLCLYTHTHIHTHIQTSLRFYRSANWFVCVCVCVCVDLIVD